MPDAAPTERELDVYRERADRFIAEEMEEYYLHFAGLKDTFELEPIYERYADLTRVEQAQRIGTAVNGDRRTRELWRFSCEGYLSSITRELTERSAMLEAELKATVDGEEIGYRMLRPTIANEPDRDRRRRVEEARNALTEEHLNPLSLEAVERMQSGVRELGSETYLDLYRRFELNLERLADQCRDLLDSTETLFEEAADRFFRTRVGLGLDEVERWDVSRAFRAPQWDPQFPADARLLDRATLLAQEVTRAFGLVGVNGVDFIARRGVPYAIEVNPRYTAAMELVERAYGLSVFDLHARACRGALPAADS